MLRIYYGYGEGKTSTAFGLACRAAGHDKRVCVLQFMKGFPSGEFQMVRKRLAGQVDIFLLGRPLPIEDFPLDRDEAKEIYSKHFVNGHNPSKTDVELVREGLTKAKEILDSDEFSVVILDEILTALEFKMIEAADILNLARINKAELVLTGRGITAELIEAGDYVTRYQYVKHPFTKGVLARQGYDY
ncbi:MAG: cob(I)yrinic acid a,c-diamide adenosyltransferase [Chloroflexi bacterium]|nr:cob(I)yrinic acid a,c-diamide adenosyltransferase [Chloroflexota bacterium]